VLQLQVRCGNHECSPDIDELHLLYKMWMQRQIHNLALFIFRIMNPNLVSNVKISLLENNFQSTRTRIGANFCYILCHPSPYESSI
jgi:hypothetical protein